MDFEKYKNEIQKTGFITEYQVAEKLKEDGWSTINNRYYVDDEKKIIREIDLIGYKISKFDKILMYTVLIISCKKDEKNLWALLSKKVNLTDPNKEWRPIIIWSNDKAINYILQEQTWKDSYFEYVSNYDLGNSIKIPENDIFAYQEMNIESGKTQNDKKIFRSIESLVKAQAYELKSLPERKKENVIYQFNLISLISSKIIRIDMGEQEEIHEVDEEICIKDYIINNKQSCVKIHFINNKILERILENYTNLHNANYAYFKKEQKKFYEDMIINKEKRDYIKDDFIKEIKETIDIFLIFAPKDEYSIFELGYDNDENKLKIYIDLSKENIERINKDAIVNNNTSIALRKIFKFRGEFEYFEYDIPF